MRAQLSVAPSGLSRHSSRASGSVGVPVREAVRRRVVQRIAVGQAVQLVDRADLRKVERRRGAVVQLETGRGGGEAATARRARCRRRPLLPGRRTLPRGSASHQDFSSERCRGGDVGEDAGDSAAASAAGQTGSCSGGPAGAGRSQRFADARRGRGRPSRGRRGHGVPSGGMRRSVSRVPLGDLWDLFGNSAKSVAISRRQSAKSPYFAVVRPIARCKGDAHWPLSARGPTCACRRGSLEHGRLIVRASATRDGIPRPVFTVPDDHGRSRPAVADALASGRARSDNKLDATRALEQRN